MRILLSFPLLFAAFAPLSAPARSQGTAEDIQGSDSSPIIIEDRPAEGDEAATPIRREEEDFVQIRGAWATDKAACATVEEEGGGGLYVTDTLIRWEDSTCSIREIDAEDGAATIFALCATESERRERKFRLVANGESRLTLSFFAGNEEQEISLRRCERQQ